MKSLLCAVVAFMAAVSLSYAYADDLIQDGRSMTVNAKIKPDE